MEQDHLMMLLLKRKLITLKRTIIIKVKNWKLGQCTELRQPEKIALQIIPVSWEKLSGTNWSLVTTNDLKKYYYNTVNKAKDNLRNDPRYKTVNHEEREALFNEYIAELRAVEQEAERAAKAKKEEQDKLKEREREMRKRKEREEQEMERIRLKVRRKEAVSSFQALLVETIKDLKASWTESKPKLEKDPQGRATNPDLNQADAEKLFRDHVKDLYERCARDYRALLAETITSDSVARSAENEKNVLNSWSEAKRILKPDPRYSKMPRKDRESLWLRYVDNMMRKQKAGAETKDKFDSQGKNKSSTDNSLRGSPRRSHARR